MLSRLRWSASIGIDDPAYGTHTMRHVKASLILRLTKNLRAMGVVAFCSSAQVLWRSVSRPSLAMQTDCSYSAVGLVLYCKSRE
ncbi:phage integrase [Caballeronia choica]|jgi:hypothetical protein|uniref:Phage integrase n=1 Tax=Caballeronia choica TaxID=326476 RepID=A0A158JRK5_9BURK|nr:phage integrase [Caballeronia choica]